MEESQETWLKVEKEGKISYHFDFILVFLAVGTCKNGTFLSSVAFLYWESYK